MAKRRKYSRWRRLPGVYRIGDDKPSDPNLEPQRLTLYLPGVALDRAEAQAQRLGFENIQEYCTDLLAKAIDAERIREQFAEVEARRGTLEGLHEIADDPEYLAELSLSGAAHAAARGETEGASTDPAAEGQPEGPVALSVSVRLEGASPPLIARPPSTAALTVMRHAGQGPGGEDPKAFLPALRRGESIAPAEVAELAQALHDLEQEYRQSPAMDRHLTFALHRLAFESQILHTDAWPGTFDVWTVDVLRAVQESVERILSGQDIRYYPGADPDGFASTTPEAPR